MEPVKVAIIGAGQVGCMLARLLHRAKVDVAVFERDASLEDGERELGGTVELHTSTGLLALREAGLCGAFLEHARYDGQYLAIVDKAGKDYFRRQAWGAVSSQDAKPVIDRATLRRLLVNSLPPGMIQWGHELAKVGSAGTLHFAHRSIPGFDLIVGADGAWSKVRKRIAPEVMPEFSGVGQFSLRLPDVVETAPRVYDFVNHGSVHVCEDGKRISLQQMGDRSLSIEISVVRDTAGWMNREECGYDSTDLSQVKAVLQEEFRDWNPLVGEAIAKASGACVARSLYQLPAGTTWGHVGGMTLIGDAAHLMTPFAGEGLSIGLEDALKLSRAIVAALRERDSPGALGTAVEAFERKMFVRMERAQQLTDDLKHDYFYTPGPPGSIIGTAVARHLTHETPKVLQPLANALVQSWFFVRNKGLLAEGG